MRGPGMLWKLPLICMSYGSGYAALNLNWFRAVNGGVTLQKRSVLGSDVVQVEVTVRPMLTPPPTNPPRPNFPFTRMSTPLNTRVSLGANVIRLFDERPRFAGSR